MKSFILIALSLVPFSAFATSRTPEVYCVTQDGTIEVRVFNDTNSERLSEVGIFNGTGYDKVAGATVARRDASDSVNYLGEDFGLSIEMDKVVKDGLRGKLYFDTAANPEPVVMVCRLAVK